MKVARSNRERLSDSLLSLVLLGYCTSHDAAIGDRLKVTKLLFLATYELLAKQVKGLNFSFYRYSYGPFTPELYETWGELNWMGFLDIESGPRGQIRLTEAGIEAAERYGQRLEQLGNASILQTLRQIADTHTQQETGELLRQVYSMTVTPLGWHKSIPIRDVPAKSYLTWNLDKEEALETVIIDEDMANDFFNEIPRTTRPQHITDVMYREIYASAVRGIQAERAGIPPKEVSWKELEQKLGSDG